MFAIFEDGSHQYRVEAGAKLLVDYREGLEAGDEITFDRVLLANAGGVSQIGAPLLEEANVVAEVLVPEYKGEKLDVATFKRRKNSRRHIGHRQKYTLVQVSWVNVPNLDGAAEEPEETPEPAAT